MKNFKLKINGNDYEVNVKSHDDNIIDVEVNGSIFKVEIEREETKTPVIKRTPVKDDKPKEVKKSSGVKKVESPLPGVIMDVKVKEGDVVKVGDTLIILEAMKMENDVQSEVSGTIKKINVSSGDNVLQGDVLIEIE